MRFMKMVLVAGLIIETAFSAGERSNIRGMGMARTFTAASRGLDAVGINPANLALTDGSTFGVSLFPSGVHVGSDFIDYDIYTSYFTGVPSDSGIVPHFLSPADKQRIIDAFSSTTGLGTADVETRMLGARWTFAGGGTLAFTVTEQFSGIVSLPRPYVSFFLFGNPPGSSMNVSGMGLTISWTREYAATFGIPLPQPSFLATLNAGISIKLIHGYGYYELQRFNSRLSTANDGTLAGTIDFLSRLSGADPIHRQYFSGYQLFPDPAGSGYAADLGFSGMINDFLSFGASLTDIGTMRWKSDIVQVSADTSMVVDDPLRSAQRDAIERILKGKRSSAGSFSVALPTQLRLGLAVEVNKIPGFIRVPGALLVAFDYNQGFNDVPGSIARPRFSVGMEFSPCPWLPLRSGVSFGGTDHANIAFGAGIHVGAFELDVATENLSWLFAPRSFSYGSLAAGLQFKM